MSEIFGVDESVIKASILKALKGQGSCPLNNVLNLDIRGNRIKVSGFVPREEVHHESIMNKDKFLHDLENGVNNLFNFEYEKAVVNESFIPGYFELVFGLKAYK